MHSLMQAQHAASFKKILENADLVVPDGFPLVWLGRRKGFPLRRRVYGPELMERFCEETAAKAIAISFMAVRRELPSTWPLVSLLAFRSADCRASCPPFRPLTQEEDEEVDLSCSTALARTSCG